MSDGDLDQRVLAHLKAGDTKQAVTETLRRLGPEVFGFLLGVLGDDDDADEVFSALSERLWQSLSKFQGRCSVRTWAYVLARHEIGRYRRGARRHTEGRVPISELEELVAAVRTETRSALASDKPRKLARLREELPADDRALLVLRIDRKLGWNEIALAFGEHPEAFTDEDQKRESARLRKRFQLLKQRLVALARGRNEQSR